jgi:hypothetical protein
VRWGTLDWNPGLLLLLFPLLVLVSQLLQLHPCTTLHIWIVALMLAVCLS